MVLFRSHKLSLRISLFVLLPLLGVHQFYIFLTPFQDSFQDVPLLEKAVFLGNSPRSAEKSSKGFLLRNKSIIDHDSSKTLSTEIYKSKQVDSKDHSYKSSITTDAEPSNELFVKQPRANVTAGKYSNDSIKLTRCCTSTVEKTSGESLQNTLLTINTNTSDPTNHFDWNQTFSACLLFMDDHNRLSEWIAYHYFALPLGYLIIAVDPASNAPPQIDGYWRKVMKIEIWNDKDFFPIPGSIKRRKKDGPKQLLEKHRMRQREFYKACGKRLQDKGRTLTSFIDTDEYVTVSDHFQANFSTTIVHKPGFVWNLIQTYRQEHRQAQKQHENKNTSLSWVPTYYSNTCFHLPRTLYTAVESTAAERIHSLPEWIDALQFMTFRHRYRLTPYEDRGPSKGFNGLAKVIVDVSNLTDDDFVQQSTTHAPFKPSCLRTSPNKLYGSTPLGIHHYLGSWESYSREKDPRKDMKDSSKKKWERFAYGKAGGADDEIRPWIHGFLNLVGTEKAQYLLRNAGLPLKNQTM
mmetsp:Transcript_3619/g.5637  ORF Transcript_3619/g.5637 Transcript_3619/m.5637 type:complete len:520 (-) Transcript_3619:83-1642(-)|eukprot:CAMPEP_0178933454 /NCGR_PEP_ID=MMETSP0786-20121207/23272_1 /TAXON_ID=186022 /ORGANISM="Thalassionema frauenfeldii, Strain CCMP 1798" /LENGTH=519 /DNA_ID=CAMNT_0020611039 /DNA_START=44 /DNA_END=1603 /DNA_ORIENTATION=-